MYDFQIEQIAKEIQKRNAQKVLIQMPEGLKMHAIKIIDELKNNLPKTEFFLSGDLCYGACDLRNLDDFDLCIHFGHSKLLNNDKVMYIPAFDDIEYSTLIEKAVKKYELKNPAVVTTVQHVNQLPKTYKLLKGARSFFPGQVLGCDFQTVDAKDADGIIFVGSGKFHALGIKSKTGKRVIAVDPYNKTITEVKGDFEKEKWLRITKAQNAKLWAVIIGEKPGQKDFKTANKAFEELSDKDFKVYKVVLNDCSPQVLDYLPFDAFVITACPRIVLDDWKNYKKAIILPDEIKLL